MITTHSLTFQWTSWSLALSGVLVLTMAGLCFAAWQRSGYQPWMGLLEILRFAFVVLAVLMLNQPEFVQEFRPEEKPSIAVLVDSSRSMETRDATSKDSGLAPTSRHEAIALLADPAFWDPLEERVNVVIQSFSETDARGTDLHQPLAEAPGKFKNLVGAVLVSDGDWNEGLPPVQAATRLRLRGVPVLAVPVGQPTRLPDVELLSLDAPTFGIAGKSVRIPFTLESSLPRDYVATAVLRTSEGDEVSKDVRVAAMGRTHSWIAWKSQEIGDVTLTLEVSQHSDEAPVRQQSSDPCRSRFARRNCVCWWWSRCPVGSIAISATPFLADPGVEVSCLLFHPGLSKVGGRQQGLYQAVSLRTRTSSSEYDVVFLGDVGSGGRATDRPSNANGLRGWSSIKASGIVFMPGWQGRQILPVGNRPGRTLSRRARRIEARWVGHAHALPLRTDRAWSSQAC